MNTAQRAPVALLLLALAFLSWLMLTLLDHQAAQGQPPVQLIPPTMTRDTNGVVTTTDRPSLLRWPAARSFLRPPLAHVPPPTGPADHSTTAGGTPTPQASAVSPAGTRSPAVNAEGEAAATAGPSATLRARIAWCESRDNPRAVNKTSGASGLYQFLDSTWQSVTGLPGKASDYPPSVQTAAFDQLYAQQGARPWDASKSCWSKP